MNHDKFRPIVKFLRFQGKNAKEIHRELLETYSEDVPSYSCVTKWLRAHEKFGGLGPRGHSSGRPVDVSAPERIDQVRSLLLNERKLSIRDISEIIDLPYSTVRRIIVDKLGMTKKFARWVPKILTGIEKLQDNARIHTASVSLAKIKETGLKIMPHPPYSPDISPCDYYLFRNLKSHLKLRTFQDQGQIEAAIDGYFAEKEVTWFERGIDELPERNQKVSNLEGGYVIE